MKNMRKGLTLIELVVVTAIILLLIGLTLPAISKARAASTRVKSSNQLRQICLGVHNYASNNSGLIPGVVSANELNRDRDSAPLGAIGPYIDNYRNRPSTQEGLISNPTWRWVKLYISPADFSAPQLDVLRDSAYSITSYSTNMCAFEGLPNINASFTDGLSNTIFFAERLCFLKVPQVYYVFDTLFNYPRSEFDHGERRASFADRGWHDVVPVSAGNPAVTFASSPGSTFLSGADLNCANSHLLASPYPWGLHVAMGDGSIKLIRSSISESAFWAQVTRDAGDSITD